MHMADALLSPAVGGTMAVVSVGAIAYAVTKIKKEDSFDEKKIPLMAVSGAFVFAAQMINFTIPGTGSSGHIGGGILLAALLGPYPALITISSVLLIQSLFFADGGLLALGCNIFNLGVITCLLAYPLLYKPIIAGTLSKGRIYAASIVAVIVGLQLGSFFVVLQTLASGITELPFTTFLIFMQPIHLAIGVIEGIITGTVLVFIQAARPEILTSALANDSMRSVSTKKVVVGLLVVAVAVGGGLSLFASSFPDGLEWSMEAVAGTPELHAHSNTHVAAGDIQSTTSFMPDYSFKGGDGGTSVAGIVGGGLTLAVAGLTGLLIYAGKRRNRCKE